MFSTTIQIQTLILSSASRPVDEVINSMLDGHSDNEVYDILKAILSTGIEHDEQVSEIIRAAWSKLLSTGCWHSFFPDEHTLKTTFQYNEAIKPAIDRLANQDRNIMASI